MEVVFPQSDSLFDNWNKRLDAVNLFNIDRLPIERFTLNEVRNEAKQFVNEENIDDAYKEKLSDLHWKINYISNILEQKLAQIDSLFFAKASEFEQDGNEREAVFYYKRSLDLTPSYCLSIEKLSSIYAKNHQNEQHIELLQFLSSDNRLKNCSPQLFNTAFDSLLTQANNLIEKQNYYDAVKVLDTTKLFLYYVPQEKYMQSYTVLLASAQNGIYSSYYDIINGAIKVRNLPLAEEYLFGLFLVIEKNNQQAHQNYFFSQAVQNLIVAYQKRK
jgi:hypothetical protein